MTNGYHKPKSLKKEAGVKKTAKAKRTPTTRRPKPKPEEGSTS